MDCNKRGDVGDLHSKLFEMKSDASTAILLRMVMVKLGGYKGQLNMVQVKGCKSP